MHHCFCQISDLSVFLIRCQIFFSLSENPIASAFIYYILHNTLTYILILQIGKYQILILAFCAFLTSNGHYSVGTHQSLSCLFVACCCYSTLSPLPTKCPVSALTACIPRCLLLCRLSDPPLPSSMFPLHSSLSCRACLTCAPPPPLPGLFLHLPHSGPALGHRGAL